MSSEITTDPSTCLFFMAVSFPIIFMFSFCMVLFVLSVGFYKFEVVNLDGMLLTEDLSRSSGMLTVGVLVAPLHTEPRSPGTLAYCTLVPLHPCILYPGTLAYCAFTTLVHLAYCILCG